jgi:DNA-binding PadR family transcriptional regulator
MSLTHALLGVLDARPMNGYELTKFFDSATRWVWSAPQSQIYTTLPKMEADGLIEGSTQERGTRMKTQVYAITDKGRKELAQWAGTPHPLPPHRDAFFLQALFLDMVDEQAAAAVLENFIAEHEEMIRRWSEHRDLLLAGATPLMRERLAARPAAEHGRIVALKAQAFQGEIARATALVQWARDTLDLITSE